MNFLTKTMPLIGFFGSSGGTSGFGLQIGTVPTIPGRLASMGSATADDHTAGASQASSAVSAPLIPGRGAPPSCTPESTRFALQDAMDVDGDPQVALAREHSQQEREQLASRFANRPSSRGRQKCCQCNGNGLCIRCACASSGSPCINCLPSKRQHCADSVPAQISQPTIGPTAPSQGTAQATVSSNLHGRQPTSQPTSHPTSQPTRQLTSQPVSQTVPVRRPPSQAMNQPTSQPVSQSTTPMDTASGSSTT